MKQFKIRLLFIGSLLCVGAAVVIVRLFSIQVLHGEEFAARSRSQSQQRCVLPAPRGTIYDRNGKVLAASTQNDLSLSMDVFGPARMKGAVAPQKRAYPLGEAEGPVVGYVGRDGYGLGGVEFSFDKYLHGEDGWTILRKDGRNHRDRKIGLPYKGPRPGGDVYLTIDAEIQKIAYSVLKQAVTFQGARGGMCMVVEPATGDILAMVNEPSFDPNAPGKYSLERRSNTCISTVFEPGSTFKIVTAAAALQDNIKNEQDSIDGNNGVYVVYNERIRDHHPYGKLSFVQAMSVSSNVCFAKIARDLGNSRLYRYTGEFGFGSRSGIELPGEEGGIVHPVRSWSGRTLATMAIGQEVSVTFLQMMMAYATVANDGVLVQPRICEKIISSDGTVAETQRVKPVRRILSEQNALRLRSMLRVVVDSGTGKKAAVDNVAIGGKTGTAQKLNSGGYSKTRSWTSFIGFFPVDKPILVCGVVIDEPANNLMGGSSAAPVFKKAVTQIVSHPGLAYAEKILQDRIVPPKPEGRQSSGAERIANMVVPVGGGRTEHSQQPESLVRRATAAPSNQVPDCIGRDARDAVNLINQGGMVPCIIGTGTVRRQYPAAGVRFFSAAVCTLYCSWEG
jgi:cell division protein FtsI (penicillin-binding protein 3)